VDAPVLSFCNWPPVLLTINAILFKVAPEIAPFDFGDSTLNAGEAAQTQCLAIKGDTPLNITWTFHGDVTTFQAGVVTASVGQRGSALIIDSVTTNHAGTYTCTVRNQVASASYSTVLSVSG
jgi:hypothetical protein